jgi:hypothetical protein
MSNDEGMTNLEFSKGASANSESVPNWNLVIRICFVTRHSDFVILHIRVHSWLKRKTQHLDRGGDLDVLVANNEVQRARG